MGRSPALGISNTTRPVLSDLVPCHNVNGFEDGGCS